MYKSMAFDPSLTANFPLSGLCFRVGFVGVAGRHGGAKPIRARGQGGPIPATWPAVYWPSSQSERGGSTPDILATRNAI